jgi:plastocyanin
MHSARRLRGLPLAVAALLFTIAVGAQSPTGDTSAPRSSLSLMNDVSQHFQRLETRLSSGDLEAASKIATELGALREHLAKTRPQINAAFGDEFERHVGRFGDIVDETAQLAAESRLSDAAAAFEDLRAACVSCHVKFRSNNTERGHYPARLNTIAGSVVLRDADDRVREDRSWVLAFLESTDAPPTPVHVRQNPRVSQSGRRFHPRVLPVVVGTRVEFPNDDTIFHNVFSLSKTAPFDLGVYEPGHSSSVRMERTGLIKVYCNIHPEMTASIVVLANPWYALTDSTGQFVLCGVPDGDYVLRAWNDMGAETREPIHVGGNTVLPVHVELRETRRAVTHANKYGKPYSGKYP